MKSEVASLMLQLYSIRLAVVISVLLMLALFPCNQARGGENEQHFSRLESNNNNQNIGLQRVFFTLDPNERENKTQGRKRLTLKLALFLGLSLFLYSY
jgi:hypothetical protein